MARFEFRILTDDEGVSEEDMIAEGLAATEAAIAINLLHFRRHPEDICALACGRVKYDTENKDVLSMISEIATVPVLIEQGKGLCIDLVGFDVAVRRFEGQQAWPHIFFKGGGIFHVITQFLDWRGRAVTYDVSSELEQRGLAISYQPESCSSCPPRKRRRGRAA